MEKIVEKLKVNLKEELEKVDLDTICEFEKTLDNLEIDKIKIYNATDEDKTVSLLFYGGQFFAINRINFKDGYEYENPNLALSENLNYKIRKIPNVSKTRKILNINNIEARIYDVSDYVVLLQKEDIQILKVNGFSSLSEMKYNEYQIDKNKITEKIEEEKYEINVESKKEKITEIFKKIFIKPITLIKKKLIKTKEIKMLSDGKHSIFEKAEE